MSGLTGVRVVARLLAVAVLLGSGFYVLVYLYRWEWNRALMAGVFFLAAEVALIGAAIVTRLQVLEQRVDRRSGIPGSDRPAPGASAEPARGPFAWLDEATGGFGVFIPILLGAGLILSMFAWVVERLARFVTAPAARPGGLSAFASLDLSSGALVPDATTVDLTGVGVLEATHPPRRRTAVHWAVTFVSMLVLMMGIWFLREAAESRPGGGGSGTTAIELEIETRETGATTQQLVDALWVACRLRLPVDARLVSAAVRSPGQAEMVVAPGLGETDRRQFAGCLGDTILDRVDADVTGMQTTPARREPVS